MEINKENKMKKNIKRIAVVGVAFVCCAAIALAVALKLPNAQKVGTGALSFGLPMENATVVKDYADDRLQEIPEMKRWEIHLAVDMTSSDNSVFAICDGVISSIVSNPLQGKVITINHDGGFVSIYGSLERNADFQEGDVVKKGQVIGKASNSASNEGKNEAYLHFTLLKDGKKVDPNLYLDLQNK